MFDFSTGSRARSAPGWLLGLLLGTLMLSASHGARAQTLELVIGTKIAPPFVVRAKDGSLDGISIELWKYITEKNGWSYRFEERTLSELLDGVADGSLDAAVAALTVTAERELRLDFSHPFHTTGLGIAVSDRASGSIWTIAARFISLDFLRAVAGLTVLLLAVGALVWIFERRRNAEQFGGPWWRGLGSGFWWSAVTMTTVGYGDKAPQTMAGRLVAIVWMFAAIILISGVTAAITAALTVNSLEGAIRGPQDLSGVRVAAVRDATGSEYLRTELIGHRTVDDVDAGLAALARGEIDALVHDAPLLRYRIRESYDEDLHVLPATFVRQDYAIALQQGSPLKEPLNRALIERVQQAEWQQVLLRYLGEAE